MSAAASTAGSTDGAPGNLPSLAGLAVLVGVITGAIAALFRLTLEWVAQRRSVLLRLADEIGPATLPLAVLGCGAAAALAAAMVHHISPYAEGSGIPRVESVVAGELRPAHLRLLPVKFVGGVLAIGSGLVLGREGPSVQMGGSSGHAIARFFRRSAVDDRVLIAAGAGAGLATAFNAPVAGAVFVLEELLRRFDTRVTIATLGASGGAMVAARLILGNQIEFATPILLEPVPMHAWGFLLLGAVCGVLGALYNASLLWAMTWTQSGVFGRRPVARAFAIGGLIGLVGWLAPYLIGGGEHLVQDSLTGRFSAGVLVGFLVIRFGLGIASYAARTPGGLFAPMLVIGTQIGLLFGMVGHQLFPTQVPDTIAYAIVGMAAFFTAVVRAPVTGMVLVMEMTDAMPLLPPMLGACFVAMLVTTLLRIAPIYESLAARARAATRAEEAEQAKNSPPPAA